MTEQEAYVEKMEAEGIPRAAIDTYKRAMNGDDPELLAALLLAVSTDRNSYQMVEGPFGPGQRFVT